MGYDDGNARFARYFPVAGSVTAINDEAVEDLDKLESDPYGDGWVVEITMANPAELGHLLTAAQYDAQTSE